MNDDEKAKLLYERARRTGETVEGLTEYEAVLVLAYVSGNILSSITEENNNRAVMTDAFIKTVLSTQEMNIDQSPNE